MTRFRLFPKFAALIWLLGWPLSAVAESELAPETMGRAPGLSVDGQTASFEWSFEDGNLVINGGPQTIATVPYRALPRPCALNAMCAPPASPMGVFVDLPRHRVFVSRCRVNRPVCPADELFEVKLPGVAVRKVGTVTGTGVTEVALSPSGGRLALIDWQAPKEAPALFVLDLATAEVRTQAITSSFYVSQGDVFIDYDLRPKWAGDGTLIVVTTDGRRFRPERIDVASMKPAK